MADWMSVRCAQVPDGETQPSTDVDLFISTEKIMVLNTDLKVRFLSQMWWEVGAPGLVSLSADCITIREGFFKIII